MAAFKARDKYDENRASATTWLYIIAANISKRHRRGRFRSGRLQERVATHEVPLKPPLPDEQIAREQNAALVHEVMQKLPFKQREVFSLYELEGLDGNTIAQMVGIPEGSGGGGAA